MPADPTRPADATGASPLLNHGLTRFVCTVAIGAVGGAVFAFLGAPLAWMLGAMTTSSAAALLGLPVRINNRIRSLMLIVLGTMLGSSFSPEILGRIADWSFSIGNLVLYTIAAGALGYFVYKHIFGYITPTAYFSGAPGGFNEMVVMGTEKGGDERTISLSHATRVFIVVMIIPIWFRFSSDYQQPPPLSSADLLIPLPDLALLTVGAVVGLLLARLLRIPAAHLTGPMVASALIHLFGWTSAAPPPPLIALSQIIIGAAIGARFTGISFTDIARAVSASSITSGLMMVLSVLFATIMTVLTGIPFAPLLLALAPGGLAEMSLVALALNVDIAFVATHHIARIFLVMLLAPLFFKTIARLNPPPK